MKFGFDCHAKIFQLHKTKLISHKFIYSNSNKIRAPSNEENKEKKTEKISVFYYALSMSLKLAIDKFKPSI